MPLSEIAKLTGHKLRTLQQAAKRGFLNVDKVDIPGGFYYVSSIKAVEAWQNNEKAHKPGPKTN